MALQTVDCNSWEEFTAAVQQRQAEHAALVAGNPYVKITPLLFRGQRDASWKLETTLERYGTSALTLAKYYTSISAAKPQIEAHTQERWEIEPPNTYRDKTRDSDAGLFFNAQFPAYDYMAYLRHHGFPSPLLDWSRSPYVAAFFAFREPGDPVGRVAIFLYRETVTGGKGGMLGSPAIHVRGPYVRTHRRHFLQQCQYTVCMVFKGLPPQGEWHYASHEDVFASAVGLAAGQDQLWKFTLPRSERRRVLAYLDEHNLNAYSLFGSEEALMEMMAAREL
jgi:hypothetical protein